MFFQFSLLTYSFHECLSSQNVSEREQIILQPHDYYTYLRGRSVLVHVYVFHIKP